MVGHSSTHKIDVTTPSQATIAVDLTPVLPGGDNGGAKLYALELVRTLARLHPEASFVLLTQHASHDELATLDAPNVRRMVAVGPAASALRPGMMRAASSVLSLLPRPARIVAARLAYRLHAMLKRGGAGRGLRADLLFCPFTAPTFHQRGMPTVCTVYDLQYLAYPQFFTVEDAVQRDRAFIEASRKATTLAAISTFTRESAMRHGAIPADRIVTIPLRLARLAPPEGVPREALTRLGIEAGRYLVYPANVWRHKNHEVLLTAFGLAAVRLDPGIKLVLTGVDGGRRATLMRAAAAMGLGARVIHAGYLGDADHLQVMAHAAGLVFPSLYEGFGLPVAEAMALGVPVACGDATSLPEVAGDAALMFDARVPERVADAMVALVTDETLREGLVRRGMERAREFLDTERMAREYWALFVSAMSKRAAA